MNNVEQWGPSPFPKPSWGEADLHRAISQDQFTFHFQPKVELRSQLIVGFEALATWEHPDVGPISPEDFVPLIEATGLSDRFTENALRKAFAAARPLVRENFCISLNVSPLQMERQSLSALIRDTAQAEGFPLSRLIIEITETTALNDLETAIACAKMLKSLGVRFALDHFGKGCSSLLRLRDLPFDEMKIDKSFIRSMRRGRDSREIVAAVMGLGSSLGMVTVAEGVENAGEAAMLARMGCDCAQGLLYGKPVETAGVPRFLAQEKLRAPISPTLVSNLEARPEQRLAQLEAIYEAAPIGFCFLDRQLRYVSINQRLAEVHGRPISDHLGRPVAEIFPALFSQIRHHLRRALTGEATHDIKIEVPGTGYGVSNRVLLVSFQPARDESGEILGISVAVADVTDAEQLPTVLGQGEARTSVMAPGGHTINDGLQNEMRVSPYGEQ